MTTQVRIQPLSGDPLREPGDAGPFVIPEPMGETPDQPIAVERRRTPNRAPGFGMRDAIHFDHVTAVPFRDLERPFRGSLLMALMFSPVWVILAVALVVIVLAVW